MNIKFHKSMINQNTNIIENASIIISIFFFSLKEYLIDDNHKLIHFFKKKHFKEKKKSYFTIRVNLKLLT